MDSRLTLWPARGTTSSSGRSCHLGWATPMMAASATPGWPMAAFSTSMEEIHSPPDLITSLARSTSCRKPSASMVATSPVVKKPSSSTGEPPSPLK